MAKSVRYYVQAGSNNAYLDLRTPGPEYTLEGSSLALLGSATTDYLRAALGTTADASRLGGGQDVVLFNYAWSQYTKSTSEVSGAIVFRYTDQASGLTERVVVSTGNIASGRDLLVFTDGAVVTDKAFQALSADPGAAISTVSGYTAGTTTDQVVTPAQGNVTLSAFGTTDSADGSGVVFAMPAVGQTIIAKGTGSIDKLYVTAGSRVDAGGLGGGEDLIYLTGNWADYTKTLVSGGLEFRRIVEGREEYVKVLSGGSLAGRDRLVFADGTVLTQQAAAALRTDLSVAAADVDGFTTTQVTPFLSVIDTIAFEESASTGIHDGWAIEASEIVIGVTLKDAVVVTTTSGSPRLVLDVGGATRYAQYDAAASTDTKLIFRYVPASGDTDDNGISVAREGFDLNGATVTNVGSGEAADTVISSAVHLSSVKVDTLAPSVQSVAFDGSSAQDGATLVVGDTVSVRVRFSEKVWLTDGGQGVQLALNVGGQARTATLTSGGDGTQDLVFSYTVQAGDLDSDGVSIPENALVLGGSIFKDAAGHEAALETAAVSDASDLVVDGVVPAIDGAITLGATVASADGWLILGDTIAVDVSFSEAVRVDVDGGRPTLTIRLGDDERHAVYVSGSGTQTLRFEYVVAAGDSAAGGIAIPQAAIAEEAWRITDVAGNAADVTSAAVPADLAYKVDGVAPVLEDTALSADAEWITAGDLITVTLAFSEAVTLREGASAPTIDLMVGDTLRTAVFSAVGSGNTLVFTYTVVAGDADTDGVALVAGSLNLNGAAIVDVAGNAVTPVVDAFEEPGLKVDGTPPSVVEARIDGTDTQVADGYVRLGQAIVVAVDFDGIVTVDASGTAPTIGLLVGGVEVRASYLDGAGTSTLRFSYTVGTADLDTDGVSIVADSLSGAAIQAPSGFDVGLTHAGTQSDPAYRVDGIAPVLTDTSAAGPGTVAPDEAIVLVFEEAIAAGTGQIRLENGAGDVRLIDVSDTSQVTISGAALRILPTTPLQDRSVYAVSFGSGVLTDLAGNDFAGVGAGSMSVRVTLSDIKLDTIAAGQGGFAVTGEAAGDLAGYSLSSAGDVNGDGIDDVLIGASGSDAGGSNAGRAYVLFGSSAPSGVNLAALANGEGGFAITGAAVDGAAGGAVAAGGDINGDGLADLIVGALYHNAGRADAGRAYVVFGSTRGEFYPSKVSTMGTAADETFGDGGVSATIVAGAGNDTVTLTAGGSIAYAGLGDDIVSLNQVAMTALQSGFGASGNVWRLSRVDGGGGVDTLKLDGSGITLDLTQVGAGRVEGVEIFDLTGSGNNTLKLDRANMFALGQPHLFSTGNARSQLLVTGDTGDTVQLAGSWTQSGTIDWAGHTYAAWNHATALETVFVKTEVGVLVV